MGFESTLYQLSLGERDATTGWPKKLWSWVAVKILIDETGRGALAMVCGIHNPLGGLGYTKYKMRPDDVILQNDVYWKVTGAPVSRTIGTSKKFLVAPVSKIPTFPVPMTLILPTSSHFWGFEWFPDGTGFDKEFFEWGYM